MKTIFTFQNVPLYKQIWKDSPEKKLSGPLLARDAQTPETYGELSLNKNVAYKQKRW